MVFQGPSDDLPLFNQNRSEKRRDNSPGQAYLLLGEGGFMSMASLGQGRALDAS